MLSLYVIILLKPPVIILVTCLEKCTQFSAWSYRMVKICTDTSVFSSSRFGIFSEGGLFSIWWASTYLGQSITVIVVIGTTVLLLVFYFKNYTLPSGSSDDHFLIQELLLRINHE